MFYCIGSDEKLAVCKSYGADIAVNYKTTDFVAEVLSATGNKGTFVCVSVHPPICLYVCVSVHPPIRLCVCVCVA